MCMGSRTSKALSHGTRRQAERFLCPQDYFQPSPADPQSCVDTMADAPQDDHHGHDVHFESADAGASLTYPQQAGTIRKNGFLVIKGRPCKVR